MHDDNETKRNFQVQSEGESDAINNVDASKNVQKNSCLAIVPIHYHTRTEEQNEPINFIFSGINFASENLCGKLANEMNYILDNMFGAFEGVEDLDYDFFLAANGITLPVTKEGSRSVYLMVEKKF